jgi:hypothetical protein
MQAKRLTLEANVVKAFEFDSYFANSVVVKNETAGEILFCDGPFDEAKAAHVPAFSWQVFNVTMPYGEKPKFHVKGAVAGNVEIDFGSSGMGQMGNVLDIAGQVPHTLSFTAGDNTALEIKLTRLHGQTLDLDNAVTLTTGATVFSGDVISIKPTADVGKYVKLKINGVNYGRLESETISLVIAGETTIETEAVTLVAKTLTLTVGENTTLTAAQTRLAGMLTDLSSPDAVSNGGTVYVGDTVEFTAATTQGTGYHVTLTIDTELADLDENGKVSVEVADDITAVSASVANEGE